MDHNRPSKDQVRALVGQHVVEQYARGLGEADPSIGLDRLHDTLVQAARKYETGPEKQREAVCDSVMAISDYLSGHGFSNATLVPLSRVVWSIVDLCEQNRPDPIFCEKSKRSKARRSMEDAVRQGQLAALADAWLSSHTSDEGDEATKLERAARRMSGAYFGSLNGTRLLSARSYQRQTGQHELVYRSYEQMDEALAAEASSAGGGAEGLRIALDVQIDALNAKAELRQS